MDTIPQSIDQTPLGSLVSDRITTHPTGTDQTDALAGAAPVCGSTPAPQPGARPPGARPPGARPPGARPPSPAEVRSPRERGQSLTSISREPQSSRSTRTDAEPDSADLCAAVLLACLFCHPLDCLLATLQGCNTWIWSLCTSVCGCKCSSLQPLPAVAHSCGPCESVGAHCCLCDVCRQTTECLDFAMEVSQMLYH